MHFQWQSRQGFSNPHVILWKARRKRRDFKDRIYYSYYWLRLDIRNGNMTFKEAKEHGAGVRITFDTQEGRRRCIRKLKELINHFGPELEHVAP